MTTSEQRQRYLRARVALALYSEYGHVPKEAEIDRIYHLARVLYTAVRDPLPTQATKEERATGAVLGPRTTGPAC